MVKIADDLYFQRDVLIQAREKVVGLLREKGKSVVKSGTFYRPP